MVKKEQILIYSELSYKIIGLAMEVHRKLGHGYLEKVYENSLMVLFRRESIKAEQQVPIKVYFEGEIVRDYRADIPVEEKVILELRSASEITDADRAQSLNYLKSTGKKLLILINFGRESLEFERFVWWLLKTISENSCN
ncbi:GxxExxY protein [bacterium]|nr:GxxExxY protein [bacterium]